MTDTKKDDYVRIVDFLPRGKSDVPPHKRKPIVQAVGEQYFSLLEISPRKDASFEVGEKIYIGEGSRDKVDHIERRIKYDWLTPTAKSELSPIIKDVILENEGKFIAFYNTCGTISTRQHKLECLPKIGKRHRQEILEEREAKPFENFADMRSRLKNMPDPVKTIADKIVEEIKGESKYYLFTPILHERSREDYTFKSLSK